jgi:hypothetical protein
MNKQSAIRNQQSPIEDALGVRPLTERRQKIKKMYAMLHHAAQHEGPDGMIFGGGFYIAHTKDDDGNDLFEVFRRGFGKSTVAHIGRVAGLFTPDMFCDGISNQSAGCIALPESSRCKSL